MVMVEISTAGCVHLDQDGAVAIITLDNPPVNSSNDAVRRGILAALDKIDTQQTRAVVLMGKGPNLMAGADLRELEHEPTEPTLPQVTAALSAFPLPVIAVISGHTLGAAWNWRWPAIAASPRPPRCWACPK
ncbi:hypothetical protein HORIV_65960 [Vreelandella olivaria]|uniref:Uncharacterized protein n=1 Tax=Vreelandella olivaria TaxID=390919 RepID=A0ABM7GSS8_9GAMM|nr:hypothetical protein HORIV_65960 [Halomonas olivaria]